MKIIFIGNIFYRIFSTVERAFQMTLWNRDFAALPSTSAAPLSTPVEPQATPRA